MNITRKYSRMMSRVLGLLVTIALVGMVLGFGAPNVYAQQTKEWNTYYKPLEHSID